MSTDRPTPSAAAGCVVDTPGPCRVEVLVVSNRTDDGAELAAALVGHRHGDCIKSLPLDASLDRVDADDRVDAEWSS